MKTDFKFSYPLRVRFSEVDSHGHVFNAHYLNYFDLAISEFCRHFDFLNSRHFDNQKPVFYVSETHTKFYQSIFFDQTIEIYVAIDEIRTRALSFKIEIYSEGDETLLTEGKVVWVNIDSTSRSKKSFTDAFLEYVATF